MKKERFLIPDTHDWSTPFEELHFYKWLTEGGYKSDRLASIRNYLKTLSFVTGEDALTEGDMKILRYTFNHYLYVVQRPLFIQKELDHDEAYCMEGRGMPA